MQIKRPLCLFSCFLFVVTTSTLNSYTIDAGPYQREAATWVNNYIRDTHNIVTIPEQDLQFLANLCYFSYLRSQKTLEAQETALTTLTAVWNGWQNVAQTRLDPSNNCPHTITSQEKQKTLEQFWNLHDKHATVGKTYARVVDNVVDGDALITAQAHKAAKNIRTRARSAVVQALVDIRSLFGQLFYAPTKKSKKMMDLIVDCLTGYIPELSLNSFVQANTLNDTISEKSWKTILTMQKWGAQTWQMIEEARASFYLAHYRALRRIINDENVDEQYGTILFYETGMIEKGQELTTLPDL